VRAKRIDSRRGRERVRLTAKMATRSIARGMPRSSPLLPDFDSGVIDRVVSVPLALLR